MTAYICPGCDRPHQPDNACCKVSFSPSEYRGQSALIDPIGSTPEVHSGFTCPKCGGHHFGSTSQPKGEKDWIILSRQCHDEHSIGCRWSGPDVECMSPESRVNYAQPSAQPEPIGSTPTTGTTLCASCGHEKALHGSGACFAQRSSLGIHTGGVSACRDVPESWLNWSQSVCPHNEPSPRHCLICVTHELESAHSRNAQYREELDRARNTPCSVCIGQPLASGKPCICGGVGTEQAELQGFRVQAFEDAQLIESLQLRCARLLASRISALLPQP